MSHSVIRFAHSAAQGSLRINVAVICLSIASLAGAAGPSAAKRAAKPPAPAGPEPPVAAIVGDEPVYVAEVDDVLAGARKEKARNVNKGGDALRGAAVEQAINRRLAAQSLAKEGYAIDEAETDGLLKDLQRKLAAQQITFDDFMERHGFNELMVRRRLQWDAMWAQFLKNNATDQALEEFFQAHRREYDGTELRVSHILWPIKPADDAARLKAAQREAGEVRSRIVAGEMTFAEAARKHSAGPSRRNGGDLGFIPAHDLMSDAFSRAAFELEKGAISEPVVDQFGVHLITCTDVKPGQRTWSDARRELFHAFSREKFLELAAAQRKRVQVKIVDLTH
ncbi:MAG TPA: peptidylprolyl isomerase [Pirellulales bacterium]|nr:peptidylprolyl isomerase [Pirellulales bacterium]